MIKDIMDTPAVAAYLGYANLNGVSVWAKRHGIKPLYKQPGHKGFNVYARKDVVEGKQNMPGQGVRPKKATG